MKIFTVFASMVVGLALGLPFDIRAYTTTALSTLLNMIEDTTTEPSNQPKAADYYASPDPAAIGGQRALAKENDWLYRCDGETNAPIRDCEVVLAELLAVKAGKRLVLGEVGCRRWDYGNCRADVCASGQNYISVGAADVTDWVGKVLMPLCLARRLTGYVTNCDGPLGSGCEVFRISLGHINASLPVATTSSAAWQSTDLSTS